MLDTSIVIIYLYRKMFIKNEIYLAVIAVFMVVFGMIVVWQVSSVCLPCM